jgi:hypothetical protein
MLEHGFSCLMTLLEAALMVAYLTLKVLALNPTSE